MLTMQFIKRKSFQKIWLVLWTFFPFYNGIQAQDAVIAFEHTSHDFGKVKEDGGPVEYEFSFTNKGTVPLVISNVQATCGCTTPAWSTDPVEPGKTGFIKAQYNPFNRPGIFDKSLTVTANSAPPSTTLRIHGSVIPKSMALKEEYPDTIGNLRLQSKFFVFSSISTKEPVVKEFKIYNEGSLPINFSAATMVPRHLKVAITPGVLQPRSSGTIKITYDARQKNDYGYVTDAFVLPTNDVKTPRKVMSVTANISEFFPEMTAEQFAHAPKISFEKTTHEFGEVKEGATVTGEISFKNVGQKNLEIRRVKTSCACATATPSRFVIRPGDSGSIKISFNATGRSGSDVKAVTVYCNDPANSNPVLMIKSTIVK